MKLHAIRLVPSLIVAMACLLITPMTAFAQLPKPTYGWNLGNTMEPPCGVGCWSPQPTQALINSVANSGFNTVRIPCAWDSHANQTTYQIDPTYMAQVKQVVDWCYGRGLYVVINDHWDDGWLENNIGTSVNPTINAKMQSYWSQIATTFAGYDYHLLFAGANEPNVGSPAAMNTLQVYYETFINAVRGAGGSNTNRWLVLQGGGDVAWFPTMPPDPAPGRLMVEYHNYTPYNFTQASGTSAFYYWGPAYHSTTDPTHNSTYGEEGAIDSGFQKLTDQYVNYGIPVLVGEFMAAKRGSLTGSDLALNNASRLYWDNYVANSARAHGLCPALWDVAGATFDWTTGVVQDQSTITVLTGAVAPPPPNGAPYAVTNLTATTGSGQVSLTWNASSGATSYKLFRAAESGYGSTAPLITGIQGTSFTDTGLNAGTTYYYQVVAVNGSGSSGFSTEVHAATPGTNPDPAQFGFETDPQGWSSSGNLITSVATSTTQHFGGGKSLAVNFNGSAAGSASVIVGDVAPPSGSTITFHIWVPSGNQISNIQPYLQDFNWVWASSWFGSLTPNAWNTLTLTVPASDVSPLKQLGLQIATSGAWSGTCYIDSISWTNPTKADFSLSTNPASLTVNQGTNGTSSVTVGRVNGFDGNVTFSASGLPNGVTASFGANPSGGTSTLALNVSSTAAIGTSAITITGTCGILTHTTTINLTVAAVDLAQYNFESGTQGWFAGGSPITGISTTSVQKFAGASALAVSFNGAAGTSSVTVAAPSTPAGKTVTFHVWIPSGSQITSIQPYAQDHNWAWSGTWKGIGSLQTNAWNSVTVALPSNAATPLQVLGVQFTTNGTWTGTCYVDSVSW